MINGNSVMWGFIGDCFLPTTIHHIITIFQIVELFQINNLADDTTVYLSSTKNVGFYTKILIFQIIYGGYFEQEPKYIFSRHAPLG